MPSKLELHDGACAGPAISADHVDKIDVRVGTILSVTDVPNSEKLVALKVSFGNNKRALIAPRCCILYPW